MYPRYSEYRDTGLHWLPQVPAHWSVRRLKSVADVRLSNVDKKSVEGEEAVELCNYVDVYYNDRITSSLGFMPATATAEQVARFTLRAGDVLITKDSESWNDIAVPAVVGEDLPGVLCGYHLALVRPGPGVVGAYLGWAFAAAGLRYQFHVAASGITRFGLGADAIGCAVFTVPPVIEQRAIAAFLDRETARIDALVARKEQLAMLLEERRSAGVVRAIGQGLDKNAPTRESGVGWLGAVPGHWDVRRIKMVAEMVSGHTPDKKVDAYWRDGDIPWVSLADTTRLRAADLITATEVNTTREGIQNSSAEVLPEGTVVFSRDASIGLCAITGREMAVSQHFIGWICGETLLPEYLLHCLRSMTQELERVTEGATVLTIGMSDVKDLTIPVPPLSEQREIVEYINELRARVAPLQGRLHAAIHSLLELRSALISAAVTGQIDVRENAA